MDRNLLLDCPATSGRRDLKLFCWKLRSGVRRWGGLGSLRNRIIKRRVRRFGLHSWIDGAASRASPFVFVEVVLLESSFATVVAVEGNHFFSQSSGFST